MAVNVGPVLSMLAQRIVAAPPELEAPRAAGRAIALTRFREGLTPAAGLRAELTALGYVGGDIDRALVEAALQRDFDIFGDRLRVLGAAFEKDILSYEELKVQLLALIPDQAKALVLLDLYDFSKRPKPKALTPEEAPTLTVSRLLAGFKAGVITREALEAELERRGFSPEDTAVMIAIEEAKIKPPAPAARKELTLAELKSMLALGLISPEDFLAELVERKYEPVDAENLLVVELAKGLARPPAGLKAVSLGLSVEIAAGLEAVELVVKPVSLGLSLQVPPASLVPADLPRPAAVGISLQVAQAQLTAAAGQRSSAMGLTVAISPAFTLTEPLPRPVALGAVVVIDPEFQL